MSSRTTTRSDTAKRSYDPLAWFYNRYWGEDCLAFLPALDALLLDELSPQAEVVDLACGTGQLAAALTNRGLQVTGVDSADALLEYAAYNAPGASFLHRDIREYADAGRFEAALSIYDSLNHLLTEEDLVKTFERVRQSLAPGGLFLFDVNEEQGYAQRWNKSFGIASSDHAGVFRFSYDETSHIGEFDATLFTPGDSMNWHRSDISIPQRCHTREELLSALESAGLTAQCVAQACDFGIENNTGRAFVLARKDI